MIFTVSVRGRSISILLTMMPDLEWRVTLTFSKPVLQSIEQPVPIVYNILLVGGFNIIGREF